MDSSPARARFSTCIPDLLELQTTTGSGKADVVKVLQRFGGRVGFLGHDVHGLRMGPDGKLYFSIGDYGANIDLKRTRSTTRNTAVTVDPDGSGLEIFAYGLRNPQELVFDEYGSLWTGDNNSGGDPARFVT